MTVQQRLAEIRQRRDRLVDATGDDRPLLLAQLAMDAIDLLALVERLVEFVPRPFFSDDDTVRFELLRYGKNTSELPVDRLLTACEVHGVQAPDWLRKRASGAV